MKKSLVLLVVLLGSVALASSAFAYYDWACYEMPVCKVTCKDQVLCKGAAKGKIKLCGPCAPVVTYSGTWLTIAKCPAPPAPAEGAAKVVKKKAKKK